MTVDAPQNDARISYTASGGETSFEYDFLILDEDHIQVRIDGTLKTLTTHYTISGVGTQSGGTVTLVSPASATAAQVWTLERSVPIVRAADYQTSGDYLAATVNTEQDKQLQILQELRRDIDRKLGLAVEDVNSPTLELPTAATATAQYLLYSTSGFTLGSTVTLPGSLTALNFIRVNAGATAYEMQTPAQVLTDISGQPLDATLTALAAYNTNGLLTQTAADTFVGRTLTGTAAEITVTNGDGVSGNPTISIPTAVTLTGKTLTGGTISGLAVASTMAGDPTTALQIATKQYVDGLLAGLGKRSTVRAASTANVVIASALENGDTLDGVTLATGDNVLLKDQTDPAENGIYTVVASGAASRDDLFDTYDEHPGSLININEGTANDNALYQCTSNEGGTLGTTAIAYSNIVPGSGGTVTSITAGTGLDGGTITASGTIGISAGGVGTTQLADDAVTGAKLNPSLVAGDIIYADGTNTIARLAKGADSEVLTLAAGIPSWAAVAAGDYDTIETVATTSGNSIDMDNAALSDTTYAWHRMVLSGVSPAEAKDLMIELKFDAGSYLTSTYVYAGTETKDYGTNVAFTQAGGAGAIYAQGAVRTETTAAQWIDGWVDVHQRAAGEYAWISWRLWIPTNANAIQYRGLGSHATTGIITGVRFLWDTGAVAFDAGSIVHYGIKNYAGGGPNFA